MPTFTLSDDFGFQLNVTPDPLSSVAKYFNETVALVVHGLDLRKPAITSVQTGLTFHHPVDIGVDDVSLSIKAGLGGTLGFFVPGADGGVLFSPDDYGDNIPVAANERYVAIGFTSSVSVGATVATGSLSFGFRPGTSCEIVNHCRFLVEPAPPPLAAALETALRGFSLPRNADDLRALPEGRVVTLTGQGELNFTAGVNLLAATNPLATVSVLGSVGTLNVKAGESIDVDANFSVSCEYQVRVRKLAPNRLRLGYYKKHASEASVGVTACAGLTAKIGGFDLYSTLLGAICGNPAEEMTALQNAGLSADKIAAIEGAVKAGISRKLEVALSAEFDSLHSNQAAFLYEVDLDALTAHGREAIQDALCGDLSALVAAESVPLNGIKALGSVTTSLRQRKHTFKINLLGIYNYISISRLTLSGTVLYDPVTGDLVVTDTATARRIQAARSPLSAEPERLRSVLAESFLITAAYRSSKVVAAAPELRSSHTFFELRRKTDRRAMENHLKVAMALGLLTDSERRAQLGPIEDFGPTTLCAETRYDDELTTALFLNAGRPRAQEEYEAAGRRAIQLLVHPGDFDDYRLAPVMDNALWKRMRTIGQPGFDSLFPRLNQAQVAVIAADYSVIVWWAATMHETAVTLRTLVKAPPGMVWDDPRFVFLRTDLQKHLRGVAEQTKAEFGRPWGLIAMDQVSGCAAEAFVQVTGGHVALLKERVKAFVATASTTLRAS